MKNIWIALVLPLQLFCIDFESGSFDHFEEVLEKGEFDEDALSFFESEVEECEEFSWTLDAKATSSIQSYLGEGSELSECDFDDIFRYESPQSLEKSPYCPTFEHLPDRSNALFGRSRVTQLQPDKSIGN